MLLFGCAHELRLQAWRAVERLFVQRRLLPHVLVDDAKRSAVALLRRDVPAVARAVHSEGIAVARHVDSQRVDAVVQSCTR